MIPELTDEEVMKKVIDALQYMSLNCQVEGCPKPANEVITVTVSHRITEDGSHLMPEDEMVHTCLVICTPHVIMAQENNDAHAKGYFRVAINEHGGATLRVISDPADIPKEDS